jgi:hypothetical protein
MSKTFTSPVTTAIAAEQAGWCEVLDIYLTAAITTPIGSVSTIRLTTLPGNFSFFTPQVSPEPTGTQGNAATYTYWPWRRESIKSQVDSLNDKVAIDLSNVTGEWATAIAEIEWRDCYVVVRKVPLDQVGATAGDCAVLFIGQIDSADITLEQLRLTCSNSLASLNTVRPAANMHRNCRFRWADDDCTALRFRTTNYKTGTVGSGSTTTRIKSSGFSEDGATRRYVAEAVTADSTTDKITLTGHGLNDWDRIKIAATSLPGGLSADTWYYVRDKATNDFKLTTMPGGSAINITSNGSGVTIYSETLYGVDEVNAVAGASISASSDFGGHTAASLNYSTINFKSYFSFTSAAHNLTSGRRIQLGGTPPAGLSTGVDYYVRTLSTTLFTLHTSYIGATYPLFFVDVAYSSSATGSGTCTITTMEDYRSRGIQMNIDGQWRLNAASEWGTWTQAYLMIPDAQAGLENAALKPYVDIDLGSAKTLKTFLIRNTEGAGPNNMARVVQVFSSSASNFSSATFEGYAEVSQRGGEWTEMRLHSASSKRYWRICVRNLWGDSYGLSVFDKVRAFTNAVNYWQAGRIRFADNTTTASLQGVSRRVLFSFSGEVEVGPLPTAPVNGDTFTIERGCDRTFNHCCERNNVENFGGFTTLSELVVVR